MKKNCKQKKNLSVSIKIHTNLAGWNKLLKNIPNKKQC